MALNTGGEAGQGEGHGYRAGSEGGERGEEEKIKGEGGARLWVSTRHANGI